MNEKKIPRVSVITPVFNAELWLNEVIDSVLVQEGLEFEYILVNDGSTDSSDEIIAQFCAAYPGTVKYVEQSNMGEASAINSGVSNSSGEYVCVVCADDPLLPDHLRTLVKELDISPSRVVAYCDWRMIDDQSEIIRCVKTRDFDHRVLAEDFVCIPGPGAVIRRTALERGFLRDESFRYVSDFESWLYLARQGEFVRVDKELATWRRHSAGTTAVHQGSRIAIELVQLAKKYQRTTDENLGDGAGRRMLARAYYLAALQGLHDSEVRSRALLLKSFFLKPIPTFGSKRTHRSPIGVLAIALLPMSRVPYRFWLGLKYGSRI